jgi:hypothetical protein
MNDLNRLLAAEGAIMLLWAAPLDSANAEQRRVFELCARQVIDRVIATPASSARGYVVKAEAAAWCSGSRTDFGLGETLGERAIGSLLADLLRPAAAG